MRCSTQPSCSEITPVTGALAPGPPGLKRAGIGLPAVARLSAPGIRTRRGPAITCPQPLWPKPATRLDRTGTAALPAQPAMQEPGIRPCQAQPRRSLGIRPRAARPAASRHLVDPPTRWPRWQRRRAHCRSPWTCTHRSARPRPRAYGPWPPSPIWCGRGTSAASPASSSCNPSTPTRSPVVLVHGLLSTPGVWEPW